MSFLEKFKTYNSFLRFEIFGKENAFIIQIALDV